MNTSHPSLWRRLSMLVAAALVAAPVAAKLEPVTSVEGITEYRLPNGLQVLLFPDSSKPTVTVNVTYFVGSRHEGRGEKGMAHLLEHMVFKGTPDHPNIWKALEDHGARFNGSTWVDRTNYFETLPSEPGNLDWALDMEADRMVNSSIAPEELAKEFSVVRNEFEMGENDPTEVLWERMVSAAFIWHSYGDSTIGSKSDIERVPIKNLRAFYTQYYQPDNAMLVVAGDFKPEEALASVEKHFGAIPKPTRKLDDTYTLEPIQDGARHVELKRVGDVAAVGTVYHIPAGSHEDFASIEVIANVLADEPSGRLYKALVESGMASSVSSFAFGWREPGILISLAQVPSGKEPDPALAVMRETIEGLSKNLLTDEEVARAKRSLLKDFDLAMKNSGRIGVELSESAAAGDWRLLFIERDRLEQVTTERARHAAAHYFIESNRTSGVFYPQKSDAVLRAEIPQAPELASLVRGYKGRAALAAGEEFEATPEEIESRVKRESLDNGLRLALLPKETRGDGVTAVITLRFGTDKDLRGHETAVSLIPDMLMRGTSKMTYQQIQDKLDELKANVNMGGAQTPNAMSVNIRTDREHLVPVLQLVTEIVRQPAFPENEFEILRKEQISQLEEQLSDPQARGFNYMFRTLNPYPPDDVRYVPTIEEQLARMKAVKLDELKTFHKSFYGADHGQMTVIGDFDAAEVEKLVRGSLGTWKAEKPFARIPTEFKEVAAQEQRIATPDKQMAMVACGVNVPMRDDDPSYPALHLSNYVLGASAKSRLLDRLRQKEGLSYGAGSFFQAASEDVDATFAGMAIAAPQNAQKAHDSLIEEFKRLVSEGIAGQELDEAKASYALQVKNTLANDSAVAGMLNEGLYLNRTMDYYRKLYAAIEKLTADEIKQALAKNVDVKRLVHVQAGDIGEGG